MCRILVIDCNVRYINPTRNLLPVLLWQLGDVEFFGPGYVHEEVLTRGINAFIDKKGPFDVVLMTEHSNGDANLSNEQIDNLINFYRRSFSFNFNFSALDIFIRSRNSFFDVKLPKVALMLGQDMQTLSESRIADLDQRFDLIVDPSCRIKEIATETVNHYPDAKDFWGDFAKDNKKVMPLPHFISDDEFYFSSLISRDIYWSVVGTNYKARKVAREKILAYGLGKKSSLDNRGYLYVLFKIIEKLAVGVSYKDVSFGYLQSSFRKSVRESRFSFTCGSELRVPIRKFFEIPALGSLLVCQQPSFFAELGFRDRVNCIVCEPDEIPEVAQFLSRDLEMAQSIAASGQRLIMNRHSLRVRATQLKSVIGQVVNREFRGVEWCDGKIFARAD